MQAASDAASITIARNFKDAPNVRPSFRFVFLLKGLNRPLPKTNSYFAYPRKSSGCDESRLAAARAIAASPDRTS
jgi:ABC-type glutathione transport system ATPase component